MDLKPDNGFALHDASVVVDPEPDKGENARLLVKSRARGYGERTISANDGMRRQA